jgi:hypothetical protein
LDKYKASELLKMVVERGVGMVVVPNKIVLPEFQR